MKPDPGTVIDRVMKRCTFCQKKPSEVEAMIESEITGARICNECVFESDRVLGANGCRFVPRI